MGEKWEDGISTHRKLQPTLTLLPLKDTFMEDDKRFLYKENIKEYEPNSIDGKHSFGSEENHCFCARNTKSSSSHLEDKLECSNCKCHVSSNKSIKNNSSEVHLDTKSIKERHISIDSARDSGIGENSNFADTLDDHNDEKDDFHIDPERNLCNSESSTTEGHSSKRFSDLRGYWQPKVKKSLADRLPENSFHLIPPNRYIFPGAEVYYDPDEKLHYEEDSSSSNSSDLDSESESQSATVF